MDSSKILPIILSVTKAALCPHCYYTYCAFHGFLSCISLQLHPHYTHVTSATYNNNDSVILKQNHQWVEIP